MDNSLFFGAFVGASYSTPILDISGRDFSLVAAQVGLSAEGSHNG